MKLIIQIPCFNEAETFGIALTALPRDMRGFDTVERLIINDGRLTTPEVRGRSKGSK